MLPIQITLQLLVIMIYSYLLVVSYIEDGVIPKENWILLRISTIGLLLTSAVIWIIPSMWLSS